MVRAAARGWATGSPLPNSFSCCYGPCQHTKKKQVRMICKGKHNQPPHVSFMSAINSQVEKKNNPPGCSGLHAEHSRGTITSCICTMMVFIRKHVCKHITGRVWTESWFVDVTTSQTHKGDEFERSESVQMRWFTAVEGGSAGCSQG